MTNAIETTTVSTPVYLVQEVQTSLNDRVSRIKGSLTNAFKAKLDIMFELEAIRWSAEWLNDEIWKRWDAEYQAKGKDRAPRHWSRWVSIRGIYSDDMGLDDATKYQRWICTAILYRLIEMHNEAGLVSETGTNPAVLPLPSSVSQVDAMMSLIKRADQYPDVWQDHEDTEKGNLKSDATPYLPPEEQTHLIGLWQSAWEASPHQYRKIDRGTPMETVVAVAPSQVTVRKTLEAIGEKDFRRPRDPQTIDVSEPLPEQAKKRDEVWESIKERRQVESQYDPVQQKRLDQQAREAEETRDARNRVLRYNELLVQLKRDVNALQIFVTEIDRVHGTQLFPEMRDMRLGLISVSDDVERLKETAEALMDICRKVTTANPPSGIDIRTMDVEVMVS
jgi:cell fate (sporulation/competence/biofilm development) regulator YlbF (YheA/YmcA/DUF963 family)